jgi:tetraacyldisaccharide 4'-kinase
LNPLATVLSVLYAAAARRRRERYAAHPELRKRLLRPVISVGNLAVGGRGKTPLAASLARLLRDAGERPAILSRGYGRAKPEDGVVVVRDPEGMRADLSRSGDEPLMLARQLPGVSVLVCPDRYLAGRLAEHHLDATVHLLDDGFQHLQLERDLDLVIVGREDVERPLTLPAGRLREPLDTIVAADAVLTTDDDLSIEAAGTELPVFRMRQTVVSGPVSPEPVLAIAGIASPGRFFDDLGRAGWRLAGTMKFGDHHRYAAKDVVRVAGEARRLGAARIVTTEKDYVRLLPFRPFQLPIDYAAITLEPEPVEEFRAWILGELRAVRGQAGV